MMDTTNCWSCSKTYPNADGHCGHCGATNPNVDLEQANKEALCDHDWKFRDDSFDHEFGTEQVHYFECEQCGAQRPMESADYHDLEDWGEQ